MIYLNKGKQIMNKLQQLITEEFSMPVVFEKDYRYRNSVFFNILFDSVSDVEPLSGGFIRNYNFNIRFYMNRLGFQRNTHSNYLSNIAERMLRLIKNNPSPLRDETIFSTLTDRFALSEDYWNLLTSYLYHNAIVGDVDYNSALTDEEENRPDNYVINFAFSCTSSEPDYE